MKKLFLGLVVGLVVSSSAFSQGNFGAPPVCSLSGPTTADINSTITITASCTGSPSRFYWTNCSNPTLMVCSDKTTVVGNKTYTFYATNNYGSSNPVSKTVQWKNTTTPPPSGLFGPPVVNSLPIQWVDSQGRVVGRATGPENRQVLINFSASQASPASLVALQMGYGSAISWREAYFIWVGSGCNTGTILGLGAGGEYVMNSNPQIVVGVVKEGSTYNLYSGGTTAVLAPYGNGQVYSYWDSYLQECFDTNYIGYYPITSAPLNLSAYFTPPFKLQ